MGFFMKKRFVVVSILMVLFLTIFTGCGKKCVRCSGDGVCSTCNGSGKLAGFTCPSCSGDGDCCICSGTGRS